MTWTRNNSYVSVHLNNSDIFTTILKFIKEWKCQDFSGVQRQNYWSDKNEQLYLVTYYKVT